MFHEVDLSYCIMLSAMATWEWQLSQQRLCWKKVNKLSPIITLYWLYIIGGKGHIRIFSIGPCKNERLDLPCHIITVFISFKLLLSGILTGNKLINILSYMWVTSFLITFPSTAFKFVGKILGNFFRNLWKITKNVLNKWCTFSIISELNKEFHKADSWWMNFSPLWKTSLLIKSRIFERNIWVFEVTAVIRGLKILLRTCVQGI